MARRTFGLRHGSPHVSSGAEPPASGRGAALESEHRAHEARVEAEVERAMAERPSPTPPEWTWKKIDGIYVAAEIGAVIEKTGKKTGQPWEWKLEDGRSGFSKTLSQAKGDVWSEMTREESAAQLRALGFRGTRYVGKP